MKKIFFVTLVTLQSLFVIGQITTNEVSVEQRSDTEITGNLNLLQGQFTLKSDNPIIHFEEEDIADRNIWLQHAAGKFRISEVDDAGIAAVRFVINTFNNRTGINELNPEYTLDVNGSIGGTSLTLNNAVPFIRFMEDDTNDQNWQIQNNSGRFGFYTTPNDHSSFSEKFSMLQNGNVGIGYNAPAYKFQVGNGTSSISISADQDADIYSTGGITIKGNKLLTLDDAFKVHASVSFQKGNQIEVPEGQFKFHGWYGFRFITRSATEAMMIQGTTGNVGIGTTTPNEKLHVAGKIRATGQEGWSDFVFYDDYALPTLEEVESHIEERGHLKDIPSEAEVLKEGIDLTEMDSKLLQKIEELTLYLIEQNKELKDLKFRLEKAEKALEDVEK